jgi:hypothetical protein
MRDYRVLSPPISAIGAARLPSMKALTPRVAATSRLGLLCLYNRADQTDADMYDLFDVEQKSKFEQLPSIRTRCPTHGQQNEISMGGRLQTQMTFSTWNKMPTTP